MIFILAQTNTFSLYKTVTSALERFFHLAPTQITLILTNFFPVVTASQFTQYIIICSHGFFALHRRSQLTLTSIQLHDLFMLILSKDCKLLLVRCVLQSFCIFLTNEKHLTISVLVRGSVKAVKYYLRQVRKSLAVSWKENVLLHGTSTGPERSHHIQKGKSSDNGTEAKSGKSCIKASAGAKTSNHSANSISAKNEIIC